MNQTCRTFFKLAEGRFGLLLVFLFSMLLMGALFVVRWSADLNFDGEVFLSAAQKFDQGRFREGLAIYPLPLYPCLIALVYRVIPDWVIAGRLLSYCFMTLTILPLYLLTRDMFSRQAAFFACLAFTLLPETQLISVSVLRDPGFFLFLMWSVFLGHKALMSKKIQHLLGAALLASVSILFRWEGVIIFPAYFSLLLVLAAVRRGEQTTYARLLGAWAGVLTVLILGHLALFGLQDGLVDKYSVYVSQSGDFFKFQNYQRIVTQLQHLKEAGPRSDIGRHFADLAKQLIIPIYIFGTLQCLLGVIQAVNVPALAWGLIRFQFNVSQSFVALLGVASFAMMLYFFVWHDLILQRYMFLTGLLLLPWIGSGTTQILNWVHRFRQGPFLCAGFILIFVFASVAGFGKYFWKIEDLKSKAGSWIANQAGFVGQRILFSDPVVAFHTGREINFNDEGETLVYRDIDDISFSRIESLAREKRADLMVIYLKAERRSAMPQFQHYFILKEFEGRGRMILVYGWRENFPPPSN